MIQLLEHIDDSDLYEVINSKRVVKLMGAYETLLAGKLFARLEAYAQAQRNGWATVEVLFDLPNQDNDRRPDAGFVSFERWPEAHGIPQTNAWPVVPDLAVEVASPNDGFRDVLQKLGEYFRAGVRMVWLVVPDEEVVYRYTGRTEVRILARGDELTGDPVLPGFRLPVADLFPPPYIPDASAPPAPSATG